MRRWPGWSILSSPALLAVELQPSRLAQSGLGVLAFLAVLAALTSNRPPELLLPLPGAFFALLWLARRHELRHGCRRLVLADNAQGELQVRAEFADGRVCGSPFAGHARLGTLAIFLFVEREGWQRVLGPRRIAILRDATDADSFRRLRARIGV